MNDSVVRQLILKDWRLHRLSILLSMLGGAIALAIFQIGGETAVVLGSVWFFVALAVTGSMLPVSAIVNERKKQNLAFVMSLPISCLQYTTAKIVSAVGMFLVPWLILVISALTLIQSRGVLPHGTIPIALILATLPLIGFCLIAGTALVGESEGWSIAASVVCNSSYGLVWYFITRIPALRADWKSRVVVWNQTELTFLISEFALIALILGFTFYLQSRKRDFV